MISLYHGPISKRGNKYARKILFNCSRNIVILSAKCDKENPIYVYYLKKKQEGKHYYACLTACSTKLIRIIYALCIIIPKPKISLALYTIYINYLTPNF